MKKIITLLLVVLPILSEAQKKGDNAIVLKGSDISFKDLSKALALAGYEIDYINNDLEQLGTKFKRVKNFDFSSRIKVQFTKDSIVSQAIIRMDKNVSGVWSKGQEETAEFVGPAKSAHKHTITEVLNLYKSINREHPGVIYTITK